MYYKRIFKIKLETIRKYISIEMLHEEFSKRYNIILI